MSDGVRFIVAELGEHVNRWTSAQDFPYQFYYPGRNPLTTKEKKAVREWLSFNFGKYTTIDLDKRWEFMMDRVYLANPQDAFQFKLRWV